MIMATPIRREALLTSHRQLHRITSITRIFQKSPRSRLKRGTTKGCAQRLLLPAPNNGANASDAVKERETICTLNIIFHYREYFVIFYLIAMLYLLSLQSFGLLDVTMTCCRLLQHTTEVLPLLPQPSP